MKKNLFLVALFILIVIGGIITMRFIINGDENTWICENGDWVMHGKPAAPKPNTPCSGKSNSEDTSDTVSGLSPYPVVNTFYNWYLKQDEGIEAYKKSPLLSDGYKLKVNGILSGFKSGGYDPILMAQNKPDSFILKNPVVEGDTARVQVIENFGEDKNSLMVALQKQKGKWIITDILQSEISPEANATRTVIIYFSNSRKNNDSSDCSLVYGVERTVGKNDGYKEILQQLFMGPNMVERENGYTSMFSKATADAVISVNIAGTTAYVNLKDIRNIIPNASASCGSQAFFAQTGATLKHDGKITNVLYAINGDPKPFYEWMQIGCTKENNNCDTAYFK